MPRRAAGDGGLPAEAAAPIVPGANKERYDETDGAL